MNETKLTMQRRTIVVGKLKRKMRFSTHFSCAERWNFSRCSLPLEVRSDVRRWITVTRSKCVCNMRSRRGNAVRKRDRRFSWPVDQDTAKTDRIGQNYESSCRRPSSCLSHGIRRWESSRIWSRPQRKRRRNYFQVPSSGRADANYGPSAGTTVSLNHHWHHIQFHVPLNLLSFQSWHIALLTLRSATLSASLAWLDFLFTSTRFLRFD